MKHITAAVVIIDMDGNILGCHGTFKPKTCGFDFPKGIVEAGETDKEGAIRELFEETGIRLPEDSELIDLGVHKHNSEKDIHIFMYPVDVMPDVSKLRCASYFYVKNTTYPEVDFFEIIPGSERKKFNKVLWNKFEMIDSANHRIR